MKLRYRRILYLTFIGIFLILTPIIALYTTGYRYNFKKHQIEKTGILYIDSRPNDALIYINGKYKNKTPSRFSKLLPDTYQIEVKKDGYYPYQKELEVKSNLTTFSKNIVLFKKNLPVNIVNGEINILAVSPDQEKMIYSLINENTEELRLFNLKNKTDLSIKEFNTQSYTQIEFNQWSPNFKKALLKKVIGDFNQYLIVDIETLKVKELFDITRLNFDQLKWDDLNNDYLYGLRKAVLHQIDLINSSTKTLLSSNIQDFQIKGEEIYYITKITNESFLNKAIFSGQEIEKPEKIKLPSPSQYTLQPSTKDYLVLLDKKNNDLSIINSKAFADENVINNIILQDKAKKVIWSQDLNNLLYYTDFEIWTFDFASNQKDLITRLGELINEAYWYPNNNYIIYQVNNTIKAIENTASDNKNDIQLTELTEISLIVVDGEGKNIYFKGTAGNQAGIYRLEIQ